MGERRVVVPDEMAWENGLQVLEAMAPEWRDNLGPRERVDHLMAHYDQKTYRRDERTRRLDLARIAGGYEDLTNAYHGTVEECLVLEGSLHLDGEGDFVAGDYFWRPPGFVHAARTSDGFTALLGTQGDDPAEGSGPASRVIRPDDEAGTNALHPDPDAALGPRGWVRRQPTALLPWIPGPVYARNQGALDGMDLDRLEVRTLSHNPFTGGQTLLVRLAPGWQQRGRATSTTDLELVVLSGELVAGDLLTDLAYLHVPKGTVEEPWHSPDGAMLYVKLDGWWDRVVRP